MARRLAAAPTWSASIVAVVLLAAGLSACATAPTVTVLTFEGEAPKALVAQPDDTMIALTSARLMRERLGLPFPADARVHVYVNQSTLADGLVRDGGVKEDAA